jgi:hypothetical protein
LTTEDVFARVIGALDRIGIPYMLTGSFASSYHGSPRATQDIDIVVAPDADQIRELVRILPDTQYYVSEATALDALERQGQFNIIDFATGWKVDLIIRKSRPFSLEEFERRRFVETQGIQLAIATAEDVLIAKLEWSKLGESQRQLDDAAAILRVRAGELDLEYIKVWVRSLELGAQWEAACRAAGTVA